MKRVDRRLYLALGLIDVWYDIHPYDSSPVKLCHIDLRFHVKDALKFPDALSIDRRGRVFGLDGGFPFFIHTDLKIHADLKWNEDHR